MIEKYNDISYLQSASMGEYFREVLSVRAMSKLAFGEKYGFDKSYVSRIANNKIYPSEKFLRVVCEVAGVIYPSPDIFGVFPDPIALEEETSRRANYPDDDCY